jgi:hypothetical protein
MVCDCISFFLAPIVGVLTAKYYKLRRWKKSTTKKRSPYPLLLPVPSFVLFGKVYTPESNIVLYISYR